MEIDNGLLEKYRALLAEISALREEKEILKARLGMSPSRPHPPQYPVNHLPLAYEAPELSEIKPQPGITAQLDPAEKIRLFMSLFKGREDVYAKRWQNREGRAGYAPVCRNEWKAGLCLKPTVKCFDCRHQSYDALDEKVIEAHLRGSIVAGLYALRRSGPKGQGGCRREAGNRFQGEGPPGSSGNIDFTQCSRRPGGVQIEHPPEIRRDRSKNYLVRERQPLELWPRGREHHAARKPGYRR
jgi:hypothetical protein